MALETVTETETEPAVCQICKMSPASQGIHVFDPATSTGYGLRVDWAYFCSACEPFVASVVAEMLAEESRLLCKTERLGLSSRVPVLR